MPDHVMGLKLTTHSSQLSANSKMLSSLGQDLAHAVHTRLEGKGFDRARFSFAARAALEEHQPHKFVDAHSIIDDIASSRVTITRNRFPFSDLSIIIFKDDIFKIEMLFWSNNTTNIHDHAFCGAFTVLSGSSINARFAFRNSLDIGEGVLLGDLQLLGIDLLSPGDVIRIDDTVPLIHSSFHTSKPTCTLVIRTFADTGDQFDYCRPGLAVDSKSDERTSAIIRSLRILNSFCGGRASNALVDLCKNAPLGLVMMSLVRFHETGLGIDEKVVAIEVIMQRLHGHRVIASLADKARRQALLAQRHKAISPSRLTLLGVLLAIGADDCLVSVLSRYGYTYSEADLAQHLAVMTDGSASEGERRVAFEKVFQSEKPGAGPRRDLDPSLVGTAFWHAIRRNLQAPSLKGSHDPNATC